MSVAAAASASSPVVACVSKISHCENAEVCGKIKSAIDRSDGGVSLLDVSVCHVAGFTIYTFAGRPDKVVSSTLQLAKVVWNNVDFSKWCGNSPCFGSLDTCAFIPVRGITIAECQELADDFARKLHQELNVSVYVYNTQDAEAQSDIFRIKAKKTPISSLKPRYQSLLEQPSWGFSLVLASTAFVHFNVMLLSTKEQALKISLDVQDIGRGPSQPGTLKGCQATALWDHGNRVASMAMVLHDHEFSSSIHSAYEEVLNMAADTNWPVIGSSINGMVPLKALLDAADFYIKRDNLFVLEEDLKIKLALSKLGLNGTFDPQRQVIEFAYPKENDESLVEKTVIQFIRTVGARVPVPAGGSVAAAVAALGAALACMVGQMTYGKKQWEKYDSQMRRLIPILHNVMENISQFVDADTDAFNQYIAASRLPKGTEDERITRENALQIALVRTIEVPMDLARQVSLTWKAAVELAPIITEGAISDLRVGAWCLQLAVKAAHSSILENVKKLIDDEYRKRILQEIERHLTLAKTGKKSILDLLSLRNH